MKFTFKKLGYVDQGTIELGDMTLICGPNNVGKTWLNYAIYGLLKHYPTITSFGFDDHMVDHLKEAGTIKIELDEYANKMGHFLKQLSRTFSRSLGGYFNTDSELMKGASISLSLDDYSLDINKEFYKTFRFGRKATLSFSKEAGADILDVTLQDVDVGVPHQIISDIINQELTRCLLEDHVLSPFVLTSERTGISLFYKELDLSKNILVEHLANSKDGVNPLKLLNSMRSRYAEPIKDNIDTVRDADNLARQKSFLKEGKAGKFKPVFDALREIIGGSFKVVDNQVLYQPAKERNRDKTVLPIYLASSSIKSIFLLDLYINSLAEKDSVLIIDEPELNLHPDKQRQVARLLARLVNAGVKVVMTTHSDFLVREINNRIMLNTNFDKRDALMKKNKLTKEDILRPEQVRAYTVQPDHNIHQVEVSEDGIDTTIFDQNIEEANALQDAI
ncbi:AAA family ATPase [Endozoicomonas euniceicola]|uniref:ATP-binding protein n=1 Tax=Endozoicomonas euniceicola TaxID=1234143 RepID=A0ABY6H1C4_9GAMM|nr:ATP-binding protein [Endozoicomonas euniceicola]UYM18013.1 ATP-binding protein [Endozoicomonas euniceicola]